MWTAAQMGRKGGRRKSAAKATAARKNGSRGGRPRKAEVIAARVRAWVAELLPLFPQIDAGDLALILELRLRPPARRVAFLRRRADGRYVL